jgi:hypothetical protein
MFCQVLRVQVRTYYNAIDLHIMRMSRTILTGLRLLACLLVFTMYAEIKTGDFLGKGEFGEVLELIDIKVLFDCPCNTCGKDSEDTPKAHTELSQRILSSPVQIIVDESFQKLQEKEGPSAVLPIGSTAGNINVNPAAANFHRRVASTVSFAEDVKLAEQSAAAAAAANNNNQHTTNNTTTADVENNLVDDDDNSTLSTSDDEESLTHMFQDEGMDGEGTFLKGYMSTHLMRQGIARYAIKRTRKDLNRDTQLDAVVDLAVEAKFLATVRHPNVVKMRGTVGSPGSLDFMIIMDRLKMTLREKMAQWNAESKGKTGLLGKLLGKNNETLLREQYADKLLAVYDVARAMRYLHNHMYVIVASCYSISFNALTTISCTQYSM